MAKKVIPLAKSNWMPDFNAKACYKCEKNFNSFRRRHHCRYCGLLFCASCSKSNVILKNGDKLDRICEKCLTVLTMPVTKNPLPLAQYPYFPKDNSIYQEEDPEDAATDTINDTNIDLQHLFNDIEYSHENPEQGDFASSEDIEAYLNARCKENLKDANAQDWTESLSHTIADVVKNIKLSKKDAMDLNKYLRIVRFPVEGKCRFFKGIVFKRLLASKWMPNKIRDPKIMILMGSTGYFLGEKNIVSMQKLIDQEKNFTKIFVDLIKNTIKPNVILLEKSMPYPIIEELSRIGIAVLLNVKKRTLKLVSRLTSAKILSSINQSFYQNTEFLGSCIEFWTQKIGSTVYCFFEANESSTQCGSVLFNPIEVDKKILKIIIMKLCVQYRSVLLEKNLLCLYSMQKVNYEEFHSSGSCFVYVSTCRGKMCSRPKIHRVEYYSKNGKSLGDFIKYSLTNALQKCENSCNKKIFNHTYYYFKGKGRVIITYSQIQCQFSTLQIYRECTVCSKKSETQKLSDLAWKFSFNKFIDNFFQMGHIEHQVCAHDFYKEGNFVFALANFSVNIYYEKTDQYSISRNTQYNSEIINSIFQDNWSNLLQSGKEFLLELKPMKDYLFKESFEKFNEKNCLEDGPIVNSAIRSIEESFMCVEENYNRIQCENPQDNLEIESFKKEFFFNISKLIINLEGSMNLLDIITERKSSDLENQSLQYPVGLYHNLPCLLAPITNKFGLLNNKNYLYFKQGLPGFYHKDSRFSIQVDEEDSLSIIAHALSSHEYYDAMEEYDDGNEDVYEKIESDLLGAQDDHFMFNDENYDNGGFESELQKENFRSIYGDSVSVKVVAYFYKQFHGMRHYAVGTHSEFLLSISQAQKEEMHLGKSKALFKCSVDDRFIIKIIGERQFRMFTDFAPNYFRHTCKNKFYNMPSCLVKVLGAYYVQVKNHSTGKTRQEWVLINENLAYKQPKTCLIYDLKGTINKRRKVQEGDEKTKMDLNFVEYMKGLPIVLQANDKKFLDAEIWNDTLFLYQQNIIDYSILLIINTEKNLLNYGIIDYFEQYTFERAIESKYKSVVGSEIPTIIYPKEYKSRFRQHLIQIYFMSVE
ncbi:hypothetical protein SteCoe_2088 [Stentor coeruleus]|uniref:1-phosphatidylinositol-3-phosphate 5-kinase n=1 Tax=Stentor coeruleus TaxID=5963 RepID=A0A1R2D0I4_9CILI|nr:hypothetical protein SteCoe_2088 [Stentor coeruleus]